MNETDKLAEEDDPLKVVEKALEIPEKIVQELPPAYQIQFERLWNKARGEE